MNNTAKFDVPVFFKSPGRQEFIYIIFYPVYIFFIGASLLNFTWQLTRIASYKGFSTCKSAKGQSNAEIYCLIFLRYYCSPPA